MKNVICVIIWNTVSSSYELHLCQLSPSGGVCLLLHLDVQHVGLALGVRDERVVTGTLGVVQDLSIPEGQARWCHQHIGPSTRCSAIMDFTRNDTTQQNCSTS